MPVNKTLAVDMKKFTIITAVLLMGLMGAWVYNLEPSDSIAKASIITKYHLTFESVKSEQSLVDWLNKYHGEAPGHQVMNEFANWGIRSPERFSYYLNKVDSKVVGRVAWAIYDSGISERFLSTYIKSEDQNIQRVINEVRELSSRHDG